MSEMKRDYYEAIPLAIELGHAPLPWQVIDFNRKDDDGFAAIHIEAHVPRSGGTGMTIAEIFYYQAFQDHGMPRSVIETNAQMIVDAVNHHAASQRLIAEMAEALGRARQLITRHVCVQNSSGASRELMTDEFQRVVEQVDAAVRKATGGE